MFAKRADVAGNGMAGGRVEEKSPIVSVAYAENPVVAAPECEEDLFIRASGGVEFGLRVSDGSIAWEDGKFRSVDVVF